MRGFLKLLDKEWRDLRAVTWASAAVVAVACLVVRWTLGALAHKDGDAPTEWFLQPFVPACVLLFAGMAAADTFGAERASGRIAQLALLPVRPFTVWAAKVATVLCTVAGFGAWTVLVQTATLWAVDGPEHAGQFLDRAGPLTPYVAALVAAWVVVTLYVSTLGLRGLGTVIVGGGAAAGLFVGCAWYLDEVGLDDALRAVGIAAEPDLALAAGVAFAAMLGTSCLAYVFGRIHLGCVLRPLAIGAGALVVLLVLPASAYAWVASRVVPGADGVHMEEAWPSPDGRFVALTFVNGVSRARRKSFVMDLQRGVLVEPKCGNAVMLVNSWSWDGVWAEDGTLQLLEFEGAGATRRRVDPATGDVRSEESLGGSAWADELRRQNTAWTETIAWNHPECRKVNDGGPTYRATIDSWRGKERVELRTWAPAVMRIPRREVFYFPEPCVLAARRLPDGEERRLLTSREPWTSKDIGDLTWDGRSLLVRHDGAWKVLDVATGATSDLPGGARTVGWWNVAGDPARRIVVLTGTTSDAQRVVLRDLATGAETTRPAGDLGMAKATAGGAVLVQGSDGLHLYDRDLNLVKRVWPAAPVGGTR